MPSANEHCCSVCSFLFMTCKCYFRTVNFRTCQTSHVVSSEQSLAVGRRSAITHLVFLTARPAMNQVSIVISPRSQARESRRTADCDDLCNEHNIIRRWLTRGLAIVEGPCDALCQLKYYQPLCSCTKITFEKALVWMTLKDTQVIGIASIW